MTVQRPKLHGTTERFAAQLFGTGVTRTNALEALVIAGFVRGLSTRDIEATLVDALGRQASVARSRVSRICEEIKMQVEAWSRRRLDDVRLDRPHRHGVGVAFSPDVGCWPPPAAIGRCGCGTPPPGPHGAPLTGHTGGVAEVAFSPDGKLVATASGDQTDGSAVTVTKWGSRPRRCRIIWPYSWRTFCTRSERIVHLQDRSVKKRQRITPGPNARRRRWRTSS